MQQFKAISVLFATGVFLTGCQSMDNMFSSSDRAEAYQRQEVPRAYPETKKQSNPKNQAAQKAGEVTTRVEPGHSTVSNTIPKAKTTSSTTTTTTTTNGPSVPNMAPSVSQ